MENYAPTLIRSKNYRKKSEFVNFETRLTETIRYQCRDATKEKISDKEVFQINNCYFFYMYDKNGRTTTFSLREITKEEYLARKNEFLNLHPSHRTEKKYGPWESDDGKTFFVGYYKNCPWKKSMPIEDCIFQNESILKTIYDAACIEIAMRKHNEEEIDKQTKNEYAKKCGALGKKYNVAYVNVLRIGPDPQKILAFKTSYLKAIDKVKTLPLSKLRDYHILIFRGGRARRKQGLTELEILYFDADVSLLELNELEEALKRPLDAYFKYSISEAIEKACTLEYAERLKLFEKLSASTRSEKREILETLGITTQAIDISCFPFSILRKNLAASIGVTIEI